MTQHPQTNAASNPPQGTSAVQRPDVPKQKVWVSLHLESQSERSTMPPFIIGLLESETPSGYMLSNVLEEDAETYDMRHRSGLDFINRTYVWRCEVLGPTLPFEISGNAGDEGGLG